MRIGQGFDIHRLVPDRPLVIGGVPIPADRGALGDSDADVLLHALMDACLGAAGLGDLGTVFRPEEVRPGQSSLTLWEVVWPRVVADGWAMVSLDATVVLETPRLSPYRDAMRDRLRVLTGSPHVSVKFKSADGLGAVGAGEAVAAWATVLLAEADQPAGTVSR
jgi:2-C-methyl-D-erythritol 2,4-cyclodiphosphate synthase